ncbi:MAG: HAD-IB family hydrolase [Chitinophagaceae bacterium]
MSRRIAFFDFDGTITNRDTFLEFIKFYKSEWRFYLGFLLYSPYLLAFKLKLIPNYTAKQKILIHFFKGEKITDIQSACNQFATTILPALIRPKALVEIERLKRADFRIVIVSASAENWIYKWAEQYELELLGTRLEVRNGIITGKIDGRNCYGEEKVCRIKKNINLEEFSEIYAYGDSSGDKEMLAIAHQHFFQPFR